jgi:hypothetical protein
VVEAWCTGVSLPLARHALLFMASYFPVAVAFLRRVADPGAPFACDHDAASVYLRCGMGEVGRALREWD